jgi:hypothetical protein
MSDIAIWLSAIWPLPVALVLGITLRKSLSFPVRSLAFLLLVCGIRGIAQLPWEAAQALLLYEHSPAWVADSHVLFYLRLGGEVLAFLLSILLANKFLARVDMALAPNISFKPTPHRGGA